MTHYDPLRRSLSEMPRRVGEGWGYTREGESWLAREARSLARAVNAEDWDADAYPPEIRAARMTTLFWVERMRRRECNIRAREHDTARAHATAQHGQPPRKTHRRVARAG